jgi:hypothetical protein
MADCWPSYHEIPAGINCSAAGLGFSASPNYFASDNHFNPFLHTWSLGVEEQFYLVWPLLLLICGVGLGSGEALRRRLAKWSVVLSAASLLLLYGLQARGEEAAIFYLMPTRFWELAAGTLVILDRLSSRPRLSGMRRSWLSAFLLLLLVGVFWLPESMRIQATIACVLLGSSLLGSLEASRGTGFWLARSWPLLIGRSSYSLYLWHWPVIVLARWSVGLHPFTLLPVLALIALLTAFSYRLENHFRRPGRSSLRTLLRYPLLVLASVGWISLLLGPARGSLFVGDRSRLGDQLSNSRRVPGTTIDTVHCFRDPTAPISLSADDSSCRVLRHPARPTLFFEGDSHTEVLIPLGESLLNNGKFNVAFFARGGCPVPFFYPWAGGRDRLTRYRLCSTDTRNRLDRRLAQIGPGDRLVLVNNLPGYLVEPSGAMYSAIAAHALSVRELARRLDERGAGLILFGPLPVFPQRPPLAAPPSLCLSEWYRPTGWRVPACAPINSSRSAMLRSLLPVERHLQQLEGEIPNLQIFRPFPILCPPSAGSCSTHRGDVMLFTDTNHLSGQGAKLLQEPFLQFLAQQLSGSSAQLPGLNSLPSVLVGSETHH